MKNKNKNKNNLILLQIQIQKDLADKLDELAEEKFFTTRSGFIRNLLLNYLQANEKVSDINGGNQ